jgi:hypothetical protein
MQLLVRTDCRASGSKSIWPESFAAEVVLTSNGIPLVSSGRRLLIRSFAMMFVKAINITYFGEIYKLPNTP